MRKFKFIGFGSKGTSFGEGRFTLNKVYRVTQVDLDYPCLRAIDDTGIRMWEEIYAFKEVNDYDTE
ncbi:hypothetical protein AAM22_gp29 [Pantoea phage vB_PagM_AAM22]|nr:hypothetical protein AAM22_gp29 [Pantoea phage vB_PagM_AAM22]